MSNFLMLLIAAVRGSSLCACSTADQVRPQDFKPAIVVQKPKGEAGDFTLCADGRVLVFPASHPKSCS